MSNSDGTVLGREDWLQAALAAIGAATIVTDAVGRIVLINPVAESLTGWSQDEAADQPIASVFRIRDERTGEPVTDPVSAVLASGTALELSNHVVLVARDGREWVLDDGAAPVRGADGQLIGAVLVFRDVTLRRGTERVVEDAWAFAEGVMQAVREPIVVLDSALCVRTANRAFQQTFGEAVAGRRLQERGNRAWELPELQRHLKAVAETGLRFDDFEFAYDSPEIGPREMLLNGRRISPVGLVESFVLLAAEDVTDLRRYAKSILESETRYRRLFETAQDGILLVDPNTRKVFDANPFMTDLLGYLREDLIGKELWEIGLFRDIESSKAAFGTLLEVGYIRYEDLPLRTFDDREIDVEFVSNVYAVGKSRVIQCNIRDVTARRRAEEAVGVAHEVLETRVRERTAELAETNDALAAEIVRRQAAESARLDLQGRLTKAQEDERRHIARELHDQMGQHLAALSLGLKVARDAIPDLSSVGTRLYQLQALTDVIGREVHNLALELRPTALDDLGLPAALANYTESWSGRSGVEVDFQTVGLDAARLPAPIETSLYRIVQESLTNVLRHAQARRVSVLLQRTAGQVVAVVEDDGLGFGPEPISGQSGERDRLGILGMQERATLVGGTMAVESSPGKGTTVIVRIPLPAPESSDSLA